LSVQCGHLDDPWDVPGVAHFCEPMIFHGNSKYPKDNEYSNFVTANGGSANARTFAEYTHYYFSVHNDALEGALDRFCNCFLTPKFSENATDKE
ncbi:hypothetical protein PMAYCL1PPCAC_25527, partial [Pristionchus mayeri]